MYPSSEYPTATQRFDLYRSRGTFGHDRAHRHRHARSLGAGTAGRGVGGIDPHGDMADDLLDHIPRSRAEDVVYFNPADLEFPVGMNLLGAVAKDERHLVASGIVSIFRGIWSDFWGPRLEYILYATVAALLDCENVSLLGVQRLLSDERYRAWVVKQVKDPMVRSFWVNEFDGYERRFLQDAVAPIQN